MGLFARISAFMRTLLDDADASTARTTLGATTVGSNVFTLTNPGAVTFIRMNANNTVTAQSAANFRTDLGLGTAATVNTGTSGATIPLCNGAVTVGAAWTFATNPSFATGGNDTQVAIVRPGSSNYCRFMFRTASTNEWAFGMRGDDGSSNILFMKETSGNWRFAIGTAGNCGIFGASQHLTFSASDTTTGHTIDVGVTRDSAGVLRISNGSTGNGALRVANITMIDGSSLVSSATTTGLKFGGASDKLGFYNATPVAKQSVTGSRGGNAALADLLTKLASLGIITDSTSA